MMNKKIVVLGSGKSGIGSAILAKKHGYNVFVSDANKINKEVKRTLKKYSIDYEDGA